MNNFWLGSLFGLVAQIGTYIQLQCGIKFGWYEKYPILILLAGTPLAWLYFESVKRFIVAFEGELWPSRLIGFGVGIIVFSMMSYVIFKEPITLKTMTCIFLAILIILIQVFVK